MPLNQQNTGTTATYPLRPFMAGFEGVSIPDWLFELIAKEHIAGVILFARNAPNLTAVSEITKTLHGFADYPLLIGIDQEGGRVNRLPPPYPALPPMRQLAERYTPDEVEALAKEQAKNLRALGINLNFAPVLDVDTNPKNPVIGDRSFSSDPQTVASYGSAYIKGLQSEGVSACGKHFPGHGDTELDSHYALPVLAHSKERIEQVELAPFRSAVNAGVSAIMTAHILYTEIDADFPATLSPKVTTGILRNELNFGGVVFSDDLFMAAVKEKFGFSTSPRLALEAGCDILLVCHDRAKEREEAIASLKQMAETDNGAKIIAKTCKHIDNLSNTYSMSKTAKHLV